MTQAACPKESYRSKPVKPLCKIRVVLFSCFTLFFFHLFPHGVSSIAHLISMSSYLTTQNWIRIWTVVRTALSLWMFECFLHANGNFGNCFKIIALKHIAWSYAMGMSKGWLKTLKPILETFAKSMVVHCLILGKNSIVPKLWTVL